MFQEFRTEQIFHAAQKMVLDALLKLLSPKLPEVLTFQISDIFVASRLISKLHRKFECYVQKNIASINDDILNHMKKFKQQSKTKSDLAVFFAELNQLFRMSASAKGRFDESFLVKQVLNEVSKDERVSMMILAAQLQEKPECSLEDLEAKISEKILEIDSASESASMNIDPDAALFLQSRRKQYGQQSASMNHPDAAFFGQPRRKQFNQQAAYFAPDKSTHFANKDAKQSIIAKSSALTMLPALKDKDVPPFVQRVDSSIWDTWSDAKQRKFSRLVRDFKEKAKAMLQDDDVLKDSETAETMFSGLLPGF